MDRETTPLTILTDILTDMSISINQPTYLVK